MSTNAYEDEPYYHGLLPREDLPHLLKTPGDFLLRISQPKLSDPRSIIISVAIGGTSQKHFVVQQKQCGDPPAPKFSIDGSSLFDSIAGLVSEYQKNKNPLNKEQANTLLITPISRATWELMHEQVTLGSKLGQGAFGDVMSGKLSLQKENDIKEVDVAVKVAKSGEEMNKEKIKEVMKEARLMRNYDHPNVVKLYGVCVIKEPLMIVMEIINGGGLDEYLKKNTVPLEEKLLMVQGAAWGIEYLHFKNCIHRDLAARNCLYATVNDEKIIKISDFGLSREGEKYSLTQVRMVPIKWLAPETIQTLNYTRKSDVWSFGVLVWEIYANGDEPYTGLSNGETKTKVLTGGRLQFPEGTPPVIVELITKECWDMLPDKRSSMNMVARKLEQLTNLPPPPQQLSVRPPDNKMPLPHAGTPVGHPPVKREMSKVNIALNHRVAAHKEFHKEAKTKPMETAKNKPGRKTKSIEGDFKGEKRSQERSQAQLVQPPVRPRAPPASLLAPRPPPLARK